MWLRVVLACALLWAAGPGRGEESTEEPLILVLGDSLSAAYGMPLEAGWVNLLAERLSAQGHRYRVVNASISGETSRGGLARLPGLLERHAPAVVIIELGANDGLRGYPPEQLRRNLERMVELARDAGARVLLAGIRIPPNYGPVYVERFDAVFEDIGRRDDVVLVPFLLAGFAGDFSRFQPDGIHPTAAAQPAVLETVWEKLEPLLSQPEPVTSSESG